MPVVNRHYVDLFKQKFPSIIWKCDDCFIASVMGFAAAIEKEEQLEKVLKQASFPTFFGVPTKVLMSADDTASFYFTVYRAEDVLENGMLKPGAAMAMNGGVIFHPAYENGVRSNTGGTWSIHT